MEMIPMIQMGKNDPLARRRCLLRRPLNANGLIGDWGAGFVHFGRANYGEGDKEKDGRGGNRRESNMACVPHQIEYPVLIPTSKLDNP